MSSKLPPSSAGSYSAPSTGVESIIGVSPWTQSIRRDILGVAGHDADVLVLGPNGTGKEVVARAIHSHSRRAEKPFIPVDCASFVGSLFPSHMFGHVKGAFTGAEYEAMGCFRAADGGTLFLDEIGELELQLQAKLLRVLQERIVVPVGGHEGHRVDVRIVAATNRDLRQEVRSGRFREDLFYRLNVVLLETTPLSHRTQDIDVLAEHFLSDLATRNGLPRKKLSPGAAEVLRAYPWPGNVRQLRNLLERAVIYTEEPVIPPHSLARLLQGESSSPAAPSNSAAIAQPATSDPPPSEPAAAEKPEVSASPDQVASEAYLARDVEQAAPSESVEDDWLSLGELERHHIQQTLEFTYYNQTAAARLLRITPRILAGKIKRYNIDTSRSRRGRPKKSSHRGPVSPPNDFDQQGP